MGLNSALLRGTISDINRRRMVRESTVTCYRISEEGKRKDGDARWLIMYVISV